MREGPLPTTRMRRFAMEKTKMYSPWQVYVNRLRKLFEHDEKVYVVYDEANKVELYVDGTDKANALEALLPSKMEFGNFTLEICVHRSNKDMSEADMYIAAFEGNEAFVDVIGGFGPARDMSYALFAPCVVQVHEDNISEYCGMSTMTYAELARAVLDSGDVRVSSAVSAPGVRTGCAQL